MASQGLSLDELPWAAVLLTGTPLITPPAFTLADGDLVSITIGTLTNPVRKLDCGDPPAGEAR